MSEYLAHYQHDGSQAPGVVGSLTGYLTIAFSETRDNSGLSRPPGAAPTFNKQCLLSGHLYSAPLTHLRTLSGHIPGVTNSPAKLFCLLLPEWLADAGK